MINTDSTILYALINQCQIKSPVDFEAGTKCSCGRIKVLQKKLGFQAGRQVVTPSLLKEGHTTTGEPAGRNTS